MARSEPISLRRSHTLMAMVLSTPSAPMTDAIAAMIQDMARVTRIWLSELTNSAQGTAATCGSRASMCRASSAVAARSPGGLA